MSAYELNPSRHIWRIIIFVQIKMTMKKWEDLTQSQKRNIIILLIIAGGLLCIPFFSNVKPNNNSVTSNKIPTDVASNNAEEKSNSYDSTTVYNQGVEDETKCLNGGVTPSISEERAVFNVKFPNGTDADFLNYKNGCQHAFWQWKSDGN